ncbi:hypothetical protein JAAARDRAFT_48730 [Jaapia argillacea MUCL 33604]|uniref:Uncharacterized protein n=1 Tax=Jaapia argillacea MUCL 33604 TaxID=933084 RepID=A0A067PYD1_9AGAM|nr:hypothetical protein JAAARDRAFT_48730 [Jaapia argillacea MUCL 33604]
MSIQPATSDHDDIYLNDHGYVELSFPDCEQNTCDMGINHYPPAECGSVVSDVHAMLRDEEPPSTVLDLHSQNPVLLDGTFVLLPSRLPRTRDTIHTGATSFHASTTPRIVNIWYENYRTTLPTTEFLRQILPLHARCFEDPGCAVGCDGNQSVKVDAGNVLRKFVFLDSHTTVLNGAGTLSINVVIMPIWGFGIRAPLERVARLVSGENTVDRLRTATSPSESHHFSNLLEVCKGSVTPENRGCIQQWCLEPMCLATIFHTGRVANPEDIFATAVDIIRTINTKPSLFQLYFPLSLPSSPISKSSFQHCFHPSSLQYSTSMGPAAPAYLVQLRDARPPGIRIVQTSASTSNLPDTPSQSKDFAQPIASLWQKPLVGLVENCNNAMIKAAEEARRLDEDIEAENCSRNIITAIVWRAAAVAPQRIPVVVKSLPSLVINDHNNLALLLSLGPRPEQCATHCEIYSLADGWSIQPFDVPTTIHAGKTLLCRLLPEGLTGPSFANEDCVDFAATILDLTWKPTIGQKRLQSVSDAKDESHLKQDISIQLPLFKRACMSGLQVPGSNANATEVDLSRVDEDMFAETTVAQDPAAVPRPLLKTAFPKAFGYPYFPSTLTKACQDLERGNPTLWNVFINYSDSDMGLWMNYIAELKALGTLEHSVLPWLSREMESMDGFSGDYIQSAIASGAKERSDFVDDSHQHITGTIQTDITNTSGKPSADELWTDGLIASMSDETLADLTASFTFDLQTLPVGNDFQLPGFDFSNMIKGDEGATLYN